jgi:hypothetical protein
VIAIPASKTWLSKMKNAEKSGNWNMAQTSFRVKNNAISPLG